MAAEVAESVSGTSLSGEMNRVTQMVGWALVKHRLLDTERDAKWHNILYGRARDQCKSTPTLPAILVRLVYDAAVCECVPEAITVETSRLLTLVSLMVKVNADVETMAANLERIVTLLGKMVLFPEMVGVRERLLGLLDEGKCQVRFTCVCVCVCVCVSPQKFQIVLQSFSPNSAAANDEVRALFKQYFGPSKSLDSVRKPLVHNTQTNHYTTSQPGSGPGVAPTDEGTEKEGPLCRCGEVSLRTQPVRFQRRPCRVSLFRRHQTLLLPLLQRKTIFVVCVLCMMLCVCFSSVLRIRCSFRMTVRVLLA